LVNLETELSFIESYYHLLKVRYGIAIQLNIHVDPGALHLSIPPLTLQMLFESAFTQNRMNREEPLVVEISTPTPGSLEFKHNTQPKLRTVNEPREEGLENMVNKFRLLGQESVQIKETDNIRVITLPLIVEPEMSVS
jgi:LytS/YehU family sensor histidine kinase